MSTLPSAYAVPFWVDRTDEPHVYRLVNLGDEPVRGVRVTLLGSGHLVPVDPRPLPPGRTLTLTLLAVDSRDSIAVVRWFRPDGDEYVWRFAF
ncbi:hypothetical protein EDF46_2041 [Frondihabitans sp. PhB188]|uniref:hypothetical protein n=1 Tax=Frondihabitans sp. PhB188 TaxID=2485200 RepID=UPI000F48E20D|nr:hypothetical protein [Frondihabitans sp. PhB188]ROQ38405.1 hypothetical protein EDF46_2041 [Frondihabitans sp. PhB188]